MRIARFVIGSAFFGVGLVALVSCIGQIPATDFYGWALVSMAAMTEMAAGIFLLVMGIREGNMKAQAVAGLLALIAMTLFLDGVMKWSGSLMGASLIFSIPAIIVMVTMVRRGNALPAMHVDSKVEFLRRNDHEITIRTTRGGEVFETSAIVCPPEKKSSSG